MANDQLGLSRVEGEVSGLKRHMNSEEFVIYKDDIGDFSKKVSDFLMISINNISPGLL